MDLQLENVELAYGDHVVVRQLSFRLERAQIGCLLGPSGCGKTTALRAIAGFEPVRSGCIRSGQTILSESGMSLAPERRGIGMVFQDLALMPHLSVEKNIAFGLRKESKAAVRKRVDELLELIGIPESRSAMPHELSGGQQQRIALARALAPKPRLILLDEPFSSLDVELRERLSQDVREILIQEKTTALLVTHSQFEAFAMADVIGVMRGGELQQWSDGYRLYHEPANRFVADFIGEGCMVPGTRLDDGSVEIEIGRLDARKATAAPGPVDVLLRPDDVIHDDQSSRKAVVVGRAFRGAEFLYTLRLNSGQQILSLVPSHHDHPIGSAIGIRLDADHVITFEQRPEMPS